MMILKVQYISNKNKTPCNLETSSKETVGIKDKNKFDIITYGKDKCRFNAVLSIIVSGEQ